MDGAFEKIAAQIREKYPCGKPSAKNLSEEQKAWLQMRIQSLAKNAPQIALLKRLSKIGCQIERSTDDIENSEFDAMLDTVFEVLK